MGAGSAGCVLANRLSEVSSNQILLLEAGSRDNHWMISLPMGIGKLLPSGLFNWNYMSEPEPNADGKKIYHPRGKVLGGSSSINLMAYVRGNAADYDHWRQLGLANWGYDDVLPYFKRAENFQDGGDFYHGSQGPLRVNRPHLGDNIFKAFIEAGVAAGYPLTSDYNGSDQEGFGQTQLTIHKGRRCSASTAYLHPIMARSNLSVKTGAFVTSILFDGNRAIGIEYIKDGKPITVRAERELILSGGAINSPQIMMLSGIGPTDHLEKLNIKPRLHHPDVGRNLQDHPSIVLQYSRTDDSRFQRQLRYDRLTISIVQAVLTGTGFATENPAQVMAFIKSSKNLEIPDIQLFCRAGLLSAKPWFPVITPPTMDGYVIRTCQLRPESRGFIELASSDPTEKPKIQNNFLERETDRRVLRQSVRITRELIRQDELKNITGDEINPGNSIQSDEEIDAFIRENIQTVFHPACTCRMGTDDEAVLDSEMKVRGIDNLRAVDASAMPNIIGGNLNAAVIMMAEKASDLILGKSAPDAST